MRCWFTFLILAATALPPQLLAKEQKKGAPGNGAREKVISREGRSKAGSKTRIDFEDADIGGTTKTPYGTMLNNTKANKNYDLVPIRTDWRPEMLQSASSLDAGRSR